MILRDIHDELKAIRELLTPVDRSVSPQEFDDWYASVKKPTMVTAVGEETQKRLLLDAWNAGALAMKHILRDDS